MTKVRSIGDKLLRKPATGMADGWLRAMSGHVATPPPITVMKSRRFISPPRTTSYYIA
jgi:hypothetical protein